MGDISELTNCALKFRDERDWAQFHKPKDMALSLVLEAAELLEHFQWKEGEELRQHLEERRNEVADELCDILYWVLLMSHDLHINLLTSFAAKMENNRSKYPVSTCKGKSTKG